MKINKRKPRERLSSSPEISSPFLRHASQHRSLFFPFFFFFPLTLRCVRHKTTGFGSASSLSSLFLSIHLPVGDTCLRLFLGGAVPLCLHAPRGVIMRSSLSFSCFPVFRGISPRNNFILSVRVQRSLSAPRSPLPRRDYGHKDGVCLGTMRVSLK